MIKIFDVHTHVFPDKVAARALSTLVAKASNAIFPFTKGTAENLKLQAKEAGYTAYMNCPVATNAKQMHSVNDWSADLNAWPHLSMGSIHPTAPDAVEELERIKKLGLAGLKLHPEYQEFNCLEKRMEPIWEKCVELKMPVLIHGGRDIGFPNCLHSTPADFAELNRRYPEMTLICAHLGGWQLWDLVLKDLVGKPVYLDTSYTLPCMKNPKMFKEIILKHGIDHILYGTDSPWSDLKPAIQGIKDLHLDPKDQEKIFWGNANKIFHLEQYESN